MGAGDRRGWHLTYDHRDTGRSSWALDEHPYAVSELAEDAIAILDALEVPRAHVVGISRGGILVQRPLLDHPDRLISATVIATMALGAGLAADPRNDQSPALPGTDPELLRLWQHLADPAAAPKSLPGSRTLAASRRLGAAI